MFFTEQNLSCQELQRRAEDLVAKSVGRFRAYALTSRIFAGRIGEPPVSDCRWEPGEWFAAVVEEATGRPVSFYHGAAEQAERRTSIIKYLEATLVEPVQGATSWGFSMLLHRLKLSGSNCSKLTDESEPLRAPVIVNGIDCRTRGSLIYARTLDSKRPYTYPFRTATVAFGSSRLQYVYDLTLERRGSGYANSEPL